LFLRRVNLFIFPFLVTATELVKVAYASTCACSSGPFYQWFFPAFHQTPYTFWWSFQGRLYLAGPYSLLWWALNLPAYLGYQVYFTYLLSLDFAVTLMLWNKVSVFWASVWALFSVWWTVLDPVDFFPMTMIFLGRWKWLFLPLAIVTKLPFGAPFWVWHWAFTSSNSFMGAENFVRYAMLSIFWMASLLQLATPTLRSWLSAHHIRRVDRSASD
jgi:hypothetical protein